MSFEFNLETMAVKATTQPSKKTNMEDDWTEIWRALFYRKIINHEQIITIGLECLLSVSGICKLLLLSAVGKSTDAAAAITTWYQYLSLGAFFLTLHILP